MSEPWFPLLAAIRDFRKVASSGLIPDTVADFQATVLAANKLTGTLQRLAEFLTPLFKELDTPPEMEISPVEDVRTRKQRKLIEAVKRAAEQEYRNYGLNRVKVDCASRFPGYTPSSTSLSPRWDWEIDKIWSKAVLDGAEELILAELNSVSGYKELIDGVEGIGSFFTKIWEWIWAHREQIEWIGKVLLMFLSILLFL